jgi:hypothetical protein
VYQITEAKFKKVIIVPKGRAHMMNLLQIDFGAHTFVFFSSNFGPTIDQIKFRINNESFQGSKFEEKL